MYFLWSIHIFLLADSGLLHISVQPRFGDKDKINTFGTRIESTKTVCHHIGTGLHGYGKLGCSWKVCLPQTLLCAVITALRVCCPAVSAGTAAEKVPVSKHPAAETGLWILKKWQRWWRCCTDASHDESSRNCHSAAEIKLRPHLCTYVFSRFSNFTHGHRGPCIGCSVIPSCDVSGNDAITCTGWEPKALTPATLVLPSCATGCVLESESHQTVNRVWPSRLI